MLAGDASMMTAAMRPSYWANAASTASTELYGRTIVSAATAADTPAESGRPRVATPEPAAASSASTCPW